jgi:hypothetical protein
MEREMELPELPEPPSYESAYDEAPLTDHYSADQMRAFGEQCILLERERAAQACLAGFAKGVLESEAAQWCAAVIRHPSEPA